MRKKLHAFRADNAPDAYERVVDRLLSNDSLARQAPTVLVNFQKLLREYRSDAQIKAAAELYERAFNMFDRLRQALRLTPEDMALRLALVTRCMAETTASLAMRCQSAGAIGSMPVFFAGLRSPLG